MALAIGALADHWGYGAWVFPPLGYVDVNLVQGVAAHQFGREPVFAYLYLLPAQIFFAITLVLMAGDGGDVAAQSPPCRDLGDVALCAGAYR